MGRTLRVAQMIVLYLAVLGITALAPAQEGRPIPAPSGPPVGGPRDWSNNHVIYTQNGLPEDVWKLRDDPRFLHSTIGRYMNARHGLAGLAAGAASNEAELGETDSQEDYLGIAGFDNGHWFQPFTPWDPVELRPNPRLKNKRSRVDWSVSLGPTAGMAVGETPAIYTANYTSPNCTNDFAVYTINATPGVGTQANLVGLDNLYTTGAGNGFCSGTAPTFMFSYAIGSGGSALSPVLSLNGTKVAWIENRTTTNAYLHITNWVAGQGGTAVAPVAVTGTFSSGTCTPAGSSCDVALEYTNTTASGCSKAYVAGNSHSDLYVDYGSDSGLVSANNGLLYHIKNIFSTTAAPTVDFCIPVNPTFESKASGAMSGPVYDLQTGELFITDSETIYAYKVNFTAATFTVAGSYLFGSSGSKYNYPTGPGPLLDAFNGYVYVFSTYDASGKTSVTQLPTSFTNVGPAAVVNLGPLNTNANPILFYGAFDNNYYNNGPKSSTSTLYTCGTDSGTASAQDLFAISFNPSTGVVNGTPAMSYNKNVNPGGATGICSPITEFFDGTTDRIFVGMGQPGATTGADVVTMWNVTTQLTNKSGTGGTMPTYTAEATGYPGGASGFAADNDDASTAQAESIYFSTENVGSTGTTVTAAYNLNGIYPDKSTFSCTGGLDGDGNAYSSNLLGTSVTWNGITFSIGPTNLADTWQANTITPSTAEQGKYSTLTILAAAVNVTNTGVLSGTLTVNYTDGTTTSFTQNFSDWYNPEGFNGESIAKTMPYRDMCNGQKDNRIFDVFGYSFAINANKTVKSVTLPPTVVGTNENVVVLAAVLSNNCGGADYCAVKLTQSALQ